MNFMQRLKNVGSCVIVSSILAVGLYSQVDAQWLPDRNYTVGPGFRAGDLEIHPGVAVRGGYDTNVFRTDDNRVGSAILAVTPHLNIQTLSKQRLSQGEDAAGVNAAAILPTVGFSLGAAGTLFHYFEKDAPTNVEVDADAALSILPERPFGFDLGGSYVRSIRPFGAFAGFDANNLYAVDRIRPNASVRAQSKSGVLKAAIGYAPTIEIFENSVYRYLSSQQHEISGTAAWRFLPYTALLYDGSVYFTKYPDSDDANARILVSPTSKRFQSRVGVNGAISNHFGGRLLMGYAVGLYEEKRLDDFEDAIGEAALNYRLDAHTFEIGYQRTVQPAALSGWMQQDRGFLSVDTLFARVFQLKVFGGAGKAKYGRLLDETGAPLGNDGNTGLPTSRRRDVRADAGVHAEYRATNWLAIMADYSMLVTLTDFRFNVGVSQPFPAQFITHQIFGGVRAHY